MHFGPHKTASSSVQFTAFQGLGPNISVPRDFSNVAPYRDGDAFEFKNHFALARALIKPVNVHSNVLRHWRLLLQNHSKSIFISSELFDSDRLDLEYLRFLASNWTMRAVIANRNVMDWLYSNYYEQTKRNRPITTWEDWIHGLSTKSIHALLNQHTSSLVQRSQRYFKYVSTYNYSDFERLWCKIVPEAVYACRNASQHEWKNRNNRHQDRCIRNVSDAGRLANVLSCRYNIDYTMFIQWMNCVEVGGTKFEAMFRICDAN